MLFWCISLHWFTDLGSPSVLDYPPPPPKKRAHSFGFFSTKHFCNVPTNTFYQNVILVDLPTVAQKSRLSKCARLPAPRKRAHYFRFFSTKHFCNAPTSSFHRNVILVDFVTVTQKFRLSECVRQFATPKKPHYFTFFSTKHFCNAPTSNFHPNVSLVDFSGLQWHTHLGPPSVPDYPPPKKRALCHIFRNQAFL